MLRALIGGTQTPAAMADLAQRRLRRKLPALARALDGRLSDSDRFLLSLDLTQLERLEAWGHEHKTVCHGRGEDARDDDGDGFCAVHVNTLEGFWSGLVLLVAASPRGISQEKLPAYLGFFQFVHNTCRRGKALLGALFAALVT